MCHAQFRQQRPVNLYHMNNKVINLLPCVLWKKFDWIEFPRVVMLMKFAFTFSDQNITFKFFTAMSQNLVGREFAFRANKKLASQSFSTLLFLPVVSINKERVHFFPPELKKFQQTEEWSQLGKNNSTTGWRNAYKYCPVRQGLSGVSGLVKQWKLTCLIPRAHKTKDLGTQYNPRRLNCKGTLFNLLLKIAPHICMCFTTAGERRGQEQSFGSREKEDCVSSAEFTPYLGQVSVFDYDISFFFPVVLKNNWCASLYKFKERHMILWCTGIVKWLPQHVQLTSHFLHK